MTSSSVQKRRSGTPRADAVKVPDGNAAASKGKVRKTRRRPRQPGWVQPLINLGIFALAALFGWKLVGAAKNLLENGSMGWTRKLTEEKIPTSFEQFSKAAPQCHDLSHDDVDFTLVTQLSQDRLWMMEYHCERFPHAISIAVYTNATLSETWEELEWLGCDLKMVTVTVIDALKVGSPADYPVNILRNAALEKVHTSHVIYVDVDFWLSEGLYDILSTEKIVESLVADPKLALVLPAFMLFRQCLEVEDCREKNTPIMPRSRRDILEMMVNKRGHIFDPTNRGGHGSTLYKEWIRQEPATLLEIQCLQSHRYEPFIVFRLCRDLPPFPAAFNGYGKNKLAWMMHVMRKGYTLRQVGGAFVVHYPHLESPARTKWNEAPEKLQYRQKHNQIGVRKPKKSDGNLNLHKYKRGQVDQLFVAFRKWLEEEVPDISRVGLCKDAEDDDSKLWIDKTADTNDDQAKRDAKKAAAIQKDNYRIEREVAAVQDGGPNSNEEEFDEENSETGSEEEETSSFDSSQDGEEEV